MERHIITGAHNKDFFHLLDDYKVARRVASVARRTVGGSGGGRGRGRGRSFRPGEFDPNAEDRDADGMVQDGTRFERPAVESAVQEAAQAVATPEKLASGFRRRRATEPVAQVSSNMEDEPTPRERRALGDIRKGSGVQVRQPGRKKRIASDPSPTRREKRQARAAARSAGSALPKIGQRFFKDYTKEQRAKSLDQIFKNAPWLKSWVQKRQINDSDEQMRYVMDWMKNNALEAARRANMLDENGNLTEDAVKAGRWYEVAHDLSNELAKEIDVPSEAIYAIFAMFSAKTAWPNNVASAVAVVRRMVDNPVLDDDYALKLHQYRLGARLKTAWSKLNEIPSKQRKEILIALKNKKKLTDDQEALIPENFKYLVNDIEKIANQTPREFVENTLKGKMGVRLREQDKTTGGYMLKIAELDSFPLQGDREGDIPGKDFEIPDNRIRGVDFEVEPDGSYSIKYTKDAGVTQHSPEKEHADAFEILKEALGGKDMNAIMNMIDENLGEGSKIRSFYNNIADPFDTEFGSVTIDTHMGAQMMGVPVGGEHPLLAGLFDMGEDVAGLGSPSMYPAMAEVIYEIAQEWGVTPREAQSILWEAQRGLWNWASNERPKNAAAAEILAFIKQNTRNGEADFTPEELFAKMWDVKENMVGNPAQPSIYSGDDNGLMPRSIPRIT